MNICQATNTPVKQRFRFVSLSFSQASLAANDTEQAGVSGQRHAMATADPYLGVQSALTTVNFLAPNSPDSTCKKMLEDHNCLLNTSSDFLHVVLLFLTS